METHGGFVCALTSTTVDTLQGLAVVFRFHPSSGTSAPLSFWIKTLTAHERRNERSNKIPQKGLLLVISGHRKSTLVRQVPRLHFFLFFFFLFFFSSSPSSLSSLFSVRLSLSHDVAQLQPLRPCQSLIVSALSIISPNLLFCNLNTKKTNTHSFYPPIELSTSIKPTKFVSLFRKPKKRPLPLQLD